MSPWTDTSTCTKECDGGSKTQVRTIITNVANGGQACPPLTQIAPCSTFACNTYLRYYQVFPGYDCYGNPWDVIKSDVGFVHGTQQDAANACDNLVNCIGFRSTSGMRGPWWLLRQMTITDVGTAETLCYLRAPKSAEMAVTVHNGAASIICPSGNATCNSNYALGINTPVPVCPPSTSTTCEKTIELTPSIADQAGSTWATKAMDVTVPWNVTFTFRIDNSSMSCIMDEKAQTQPFCYGRGGAGLAFVVHNDPANWTALGRGGNGLGYWGMQNAVAVELDTWYDLDFNEPYNNHISLQTNGTYGPLTPFQNQSLGSAVDIIDFSMGAPHTVLITYEPIFDAAMVSPVTCGVTSVCNRLQVGPHTAALARLGAFSSGFGTIRIYYDDLNVPAITAPITMPLMLNTTVWGREKTAILGFTASTGLDQFQSHKILKWSMCSSAEATCRTII